MHAGLLPVLTSNMHLQLALPVHFMVMVRSLTVANDDASYDHNVALTPPFTFLLELETKVKRRFAKVSLVFYFCPSLMIIASASQFHIYLPWG